MVYKINPNSLKNLLLPKDYSFTQTNEYRQKMSKIMQNKISNPNSLKALEPHKFKKGDPSPWKGKKRGPMSEIHRQRVSISKKGKPTWNKGLKQTPEHITKLKIAWENPETRKKHEIARSKIIIHYKDTKPERMMQIALSLHNIPFEKQKALPGQPDIFIEPNICVFVDGEYWHADPRKYNPDDIMKKGYKAKELWQKDMRFNQKLNSLGYHVIRIWEKEILNDVNVCAENIIKLIQQARGKIII